MDHEAKVTCENCRRVFPTAESWIVLPPRPERKSVVNLCGDCAPFRLIELAR